MERRPGRPCPYPSLNMQSSSTATSGSLARRVFAAIGRMTAYAEVIPETRTHDYFRLADDPTRVARAGDLCDCIVKSRLPTARCKIPGEIYRGQRGGLGSRPRGPAVLACFKVRFLCSLLAPVSLSEASDEAVAGPSFVALYHYSEFRNAMRSRFSSSVRFI
jgi:hypothetical protein